MRAAFKKAALKREIFVNLNVWLFPNELTRKLSQIFVKYGGKWQIVTTIVHEKSRY